MRLLPVDAHLAQFPGLLTSSVSSLDVCKNGGRKPGEFYLVMHGAARITDSR